MRTPGGLAGIIGSAGHYWWPEWTGMWMAEVIAAAEGKVLVARYGASKWGTSAAGEQD
jgi:hypothetical protein